MSYVDLEPWEALNLEDVVFVDVRSPQEFEEFHIPGAVNVPLFENEEKKLIGLIYRTLGEDKAKEIGYDIAVGKLQKFYETFKALKEKHKNVVVYCWRGGLRSKGVCEFMGKLGLKLYRLKGGYRSYRRYILKEIDRMAQEINFVVITGRTGVGKTKILRLLKKEGLPVLDLEGLAQDRGSVFGSVGISKKVSQKMFDALLYEELKRIHSPWVFVEDESRRIGNLYIPESIWQRKMQGLYVELIAPIEVRVKNILEEYTSREGWQEEAKKALFKIKKYLGPQKFEHAMDLFEKGKYPEVVRFLIEEYYDKKYRLFGKPLLELESSDERTCTNLLKALYESLPCSYALKY